MKTGLIKLIFNTSALLEKMLLGFFCLMHPMTIILILRET